MSLPLFALAVRHLRRRWRMNIAVLLGLTFTAALLASLPSYAVAIAARELDQSLQDADATERNLLITGNRFTFGDELYNRLRESLGDAFGTRLVVRRATLPADPLTSTQNGDEAQRNIPFLDVYSFDRLSDNVRLVDGRLPLQIRLAEAEPDRPAPVEAVIGTRVAELTGYGVGDRLRANNAYHRLDIVGIVEPLDPQDDIWGADLSAFDLAIDNSDPNIDTVTLPLIVASASMRSNFNFVPIFQHSVLWRVIVQPERITVDNAQGFHSALINLQAQVGTKNATISTGLVRILSEYLARLARVRTTTLLLTAQAFIFVLYTLTIFSSFVLDRTQAELATLSGRGASAWQVTVVYALEYAILAMPAALFLGPVLAQTALRLWATSTGEIVPAALPGEAWLMSAIAAGLAWLALVLPVYPAARRYALDWQRNHARPPQLSVPQKLYLDLFLLAFGALLLWQLNESGSFLTRRLGDAQLTDPLLLMGPSLLLVAIAMVFLRLFPYLLQMMARAFQRLRGLMFPLGFHRLARDPLKPSRVVLLMSLAAGLVLFTNTFDDSLAHSQEEMARYMAGADLRVALDKPTDVTSSQQSHQPGVLATTPVFRGALRTEQGQIAQLLAVDPATFGEVARYPTGVTDLEMSAVMHVIHPESELTETGVPAVFSRSALPVGKTVGGEVLLNLAGDQVPFTVHGTVNNFPTLSGPFVVASLPALEARLRQDSLGERIPGTYESWLAVDPAQSEDLFKDPAVSERALDSAQVQLQALQSDALAQGTSGAFQLSTLTLALLSVVGFMLVYYFATQGRVLEYGVLRAMGLSVRQLLALLATEGALVVALGLLAGTVIGYGMAQIMIPYLSQALSEALAGVTIKEIPLDWLEIARLYLILIGLYGLAMLLLLLVLLRALRHIALRVGDE